MSLRDGQPVSGLASPPGERELRYVIIINKPRMPFRVLGLDLIDLQICYLLAPSSPERPFQERGRDAQTHRSTDSHGPHLTNWWDRVPSDSRRAQILQALCAISSVPDRSARELVPVFAVRALRVDDRDLLHSKCHS